MKNNTQKVIKLCEFKNALDLLERELESELEDQISFDFAITYCQGDGYCILNKETTMVAPIFLCIDFISKKGSMTITDHENLCI